MNHQYRKRPLVIEAFQMTPERRLDDSDWPSWLRLATSKEPGEGAIWPERGDVKSHFLCGTPEGALRIDWGDWIIQGIKGGLSPCMPDIFEATYEQVEGARRNV